MKNLNQRGILNILILLIIVAGIGLGSYYIRQRTQLEPRASSTVACDGQTLASQSTQSQNDFKAAFGASAETEWVTQHEAELASKGTPCGSGIAEGTKCSLSNSTSISSSCANEIDSKNPGFVASIEGSNKNTCTRAQIISNWCAGNQADCNIKKQAAVACGGSGAGGTTDNSAKCPVPADPKQTVDETYLQAKVTNNIVRYCGILNGVAELCTPADLGVPPQKNDNSGNRLLLCSRANSTKENPSLIWLSVVGNTLTAAGGLSEPTAQTVPDTIGPNLKTALNAVGLAENFTCDKQ